MGIFCASIASAHIDDDRNSFFSDSGIRGKSFKEIVRSLGELSTRYPNFTEIIPLAKTLSGRTNYGILLFDKSLGQINRMSIITGATHGNEYLNIADRLPVNFLEHAGEGVRRYLQSGGAILIVPIINPDGYEARRRTNNNGVDLNRDFPNRLIRLQGLSQPETNYYVRWVNEFLNRSQAKLDIVVDYHCCDGSLLYPYGYTSKRINKADLNKHIFVAQLMNKYFPDYRHGITGEVLGYFPRGTTKDYWYMDYGALAFTFEGAYRREHKKLLQHLSWWNDIFYSFTQPKLPSEF